MRISQVRLKGFRNFKDATINFAEKTLIIGSNDVGKSNLIHALRILLDRSLSDIDIEPQDSDFYAYEPTNELSIIVKFEEVTEDCVISKLKGYVSEEDELYLAYKAYMDPITGAKSYNFFTGCTEHKLEEITERYYRKVLNIKFIGSNRDLYSYIRKEKRFLIQAAKENRTADQTNIDTAALQDIELSLKTVNDKVTALTFVENATQKINEELDELSFHHAKQKVVFDIGASDTTKFIENVQLASRVNGKSLTIGGEGRNNQIFLALWAARNEIQEDNPLEVVIYCIEEPEAHLHPHQQRKLAAYLYNVLRSQVIITSHSPQITSEFSPDSIIRLYEKESGGTVAAANGCSENLNDIVLQFGHRMNVISAEAFFASKVLLVEGASEVLFYKALASQIGIDLDRLNVSVLMVDGVGFEPYIKLLEELGIYWIARTDNDVFKIPKKDTFRFAGVQRAVGLYQKYLAHSADTDKIIKDNKALLSGFKKPIPKANLSAAEAIKDELEEYDIYLADKDLETDLFYSDIQDDIKEFFEDDCDDDCTAEEYLDLMTEKKATFMFEFLSQKAECLSTLENSSLALPLIACLDDEETEDEHD